MSAKSDSDNVIRAFSADHVVLLTGLTKRQLKYWDDLGFFAPKLAAENRGLPYARVYSFKDLVGLRTLAILRIDFGVPFQRLRKLATSLADYDQSVWSEYAVYLRGKDPNLAPRGSEVAQDAKGQLAHVIFLTDVIEDVRTKAQKLKQRPQNQIGAVERHRYVAHNAWVVSGTRIPTSAVKDFHDAGYSVDEILKEYPSLTKQDVKRAIKHEEMLEREERLAKTA